MGILGPTCAGQEDEFNGTTQASPMTNRSSASAGTDKTAFSKTLSETNTAGFALVQPQRGAGRTLQMKEAKEG